VRDDGYIFYLDDRPVAQYTRHVETPPVGAATQTVSLLYLTGDPLGTPLLATNAAGAAVWSGGLEPFGRDWNGAQAAGVFLRMPGQWEDASWRNASLDSGLDYNVFRWYEDGTGRYERPDPFGETSRGLETLSLLYGYAQHSPLQLLDRLGLQTTNAEYAYGEIREYCINRSDRSVPPDGIADAVASVGAACSASPCLSKDGSHSKGDNRIAWNNIQNATGGVDRTGGGTFMCVGSENCWWVHGCKGCEKNSPKEKDRPTPLAPSGTVTVGGNTVYFYKVPDQGWCSPGEKNSGCKPKRNCRRGRSCGGG
jgi:RHS repeat-associated protein